MSRSGALDDNEIQSEMNKMVRAAARVTLLVTCLPGTSLIYGSSQVAFISQEAREKAREIQVKADEEFAIEKVCTEMT